MVLLISFTINLYLSIFALNVVQGTNFTKDDETSPTEPSGKTTYSFEDLYDSKYSHKSFYPTWDKTDTGGRRYITSNEDGAIVIRSVSQYGDDIDVLINGGDGKSNSYSVSADNRFVYYRKDIKQVWRHSYTASFVVYKITDGTPAGTPVNITGFPEDDKFHHMEWSPTGHNLAFIYEWNVYVVTNLDGASPEAIQVTNDGKQNKIYNGIPDWVYEEEMIGSNNVLYWTPNSTAFAYLRTDDTNTNIVKYSMYNEAQYPETIEIAYPKAGTTNPTVKMMVYDILGGPSLEMKPDTWPMSGGNFSEAYFSRFTWLDETTCLMTYTDRPQTHSVGNKCTKAGGAWTCISNDGAEEYVNNGWVGSFGPFDIVWKTGAAPNEYFTIYAREDDDDADDGRWQIARVTADLSASTYVTKTGYDIVGLYFYDEVNDWLYYTAASPGPRNRHVYRVKGSERDVADPECMTCYLNDEYKTRCGWVTPRFNGDNSAVVVNCRGFWIPITVFIEIGGDGNWGAHTELEDNAQLIEYVAEKKWPQKEYGEFPSTKYPEKPYQYEVYLPEDYNPNRAKKYPLLIEVYAGPEFQSITDIWTRGWSSTHMVSDKDVIVASVDGRGSAFEGYKFMRQIYKKLGQFEPIDQTDFTNFLVNEYNIDATKIGLWGWSYGGYATSHSLGHDKGKTFKCGIAVAPLADWRYYDSMYAERYMGLPSENDGGYTKASIITAHPLANFKNSEYVLIHGTADDNVHFQSAAEMEKALVEADVDFDDFFYADQAHSINTGNGGKHIYRQLTIRMSHCLGIEGYSAYPGTP